MLPILGGMVKAKGNHMWHGFFSKRKYKGKGKNQKFDLIYGACAK